MARETRPEPDDPFFDQTTEQGFDGGRLPRGGFLQSGHNVRGYGLTSGP